MIKAVKGPVLRNRRKIRKEKKKKGSGAIGLKYVAER